MNNRTTEFTKKDLIRIVYFILNKFELDELHHQGTSSKRDLLGGFLDRWINRASEFTVFNNLLKNRSYGVSSDFFLYNNESEKNAPDILGLVDKNGSPIARFSKYSDGTWIHETNMPFIEVKNCRKNQYLCGVREAQMKDDHYYAFIETDLREDYLSILFEDSVFEKNNLADIKMNNGFIESDSDKQLLEPIAVEKPNRIGTFRLMGTYLGRDLKKYCFKALEKKDVRYISGIENPTFSPRKGDIDKLIKRGKSKFKSTNDSLDGYLCLSNDAVVVRINKSSFYIKCVGDGNKINQYKLSDGITKVDTALFQRSSKWTEYIGYKSVFDENLNDFLDTPPHDETDNLVNFFDKVYSDA